MQIMDAALVAAASQSKRYISGRFLHDNVTDLVVEVCSTLYTQLNSQPDEATLWSAGRHGLRSGMRRCSVMSKRAALRRRREHGLGDWEGALGEAMWATGSVRSGAGWGLRGAECACGEDRAVTAQRGDDTGRLCQGGAAARRVQEKLAELKACAADARMVKMHVTPELIEEVVSRWTGIPVARLSQNERTRLLHLADELHKRVVGHDVAVVEAVLRSRVGPGSDRWPTGSFLFLGPSGIGKTELATVLAVQLFDDENDIVPINMSEYTEGYSVVQLIGVHGMHREHGGMPADAARSIVV